MSLKKHELGKGVLYVEKGRRKNIYQLGLILQGFIYRPVARLPSEKDDVRCRDDSSSCTVETLPR